MHPLRGSSSQIPSPKTVLLLGAVALGALAGFYVQWSWSHPLTPRVDSVVVKPGTTLRGLARQLYELDVIVEPYTFSWMGYVTGRSRQLKAGEYRLRPGVSAADLH